MADKYTFLVQGSMDEPYTVIFTKSPKRIRVSCSCPAGMKNTLCKHRVRLINGLMDAVVSGSLQDVQAARDLMPGDILELAKRIHDMEKELELLKNQVATARKELTKAII
jgi:hypothetical protein